MNHVNELMNAYTTYPLSRVIVSFNSHFEFSLWEPSIDHMSSIVTREFITAVQQQSDKWYPEYSWNRNENNEIFVIGETFS